MFGKSEIKTTKVMNNNFTPAVQLSCFYRHKCYFTFMFFFIIIFLQISGVEVLIFLLQSHSSNLYDYEKIVVMWDCCYLNPMARRTSRFLGNNSKNSSVTGICESFAGCHCLLSFGCTLLILSGVFEELCMLFLKILDHVLIGIT